MTTEPKDREESARNGGPRPRVLVVEDEKDIAALVAYQLTRAGYRVETSHSGDEALTSVNREIPDLVILDRMLPGISGDDVLKALRADNATSRIPVLLLTAKREQEDRIEGLEMGADDYLPKPFSPRELVLRVGAVLRRSSQPSVETGGRILRVGAIRMVLSAHEVIVDGEEVHLTPTEFRLLRTLAERAGRTQSRKRLLENAWDVDASLADRLQTRTVDMHVRRLRGKLGEHADLVETVRGFGYRLREKGAPHEAKDG